VLSVLQLVTVYRVMTLANQLAVDWVLVLGHLLVGVEADLVVVVGVEADQVVSISPVLEWQ